MMIHQPATDSDDLGLGRRDYDRFKECPKYAKHELSEEQIVDIAKKAVALARDEFYQEVGKSVTSKMFITIGLIVVGVFGWLTAHGYLK